MKYNNFKNEKPSMSKLIFLTDLFRDYFIKKDYKAEPEVDIACGKDKSVRFIGAPISILKPYFLSGTIPNPGIIMVQNCIRTRNIKTLFEFGSCPNWGSFFTGMCVLVKYEELQKLCGETIDFLTKTLKIPANELQIKVSRRDKDLINSISLYAPKSRFYYDKEKDQYYRHKYGIEGVRGRNLNIAIKNTKDDHYEDIGNIIVIETGDGKKQLGVELAIGDSTIAKQLLGLDHILDNYGVQLNNIKSKELGIRMIDAMMTCIVLFGENLEPNGSETKSRILKSYVKALSLYKMVARISDDELLDVMTRVEESCLPVKNKHISKNIMPFITKYSKEFTTKPRSREDEQIALIMRQENVTINVR